jgi:hypothetical protein
MTQELKNLLARELDTYPQVYQKISSGTMTYDEFYSWASTLTNQRYFQGKIAVVQEHHKDIPDQVRKVYTL